MKTILTVFITVLIAIAVGYALGPILIEQKVTPLKSEVTRLQKKLEASEEFIKAENEARQRTGLSPDTGLPDVVNTVNRLVTQQQRTENSIRSSFKDIDNRLVGIKAANEGEQKKLSQKIDDLSKKAELESSETEIRSFAENARARVLKIKLDLLGKNIGVAKGELGLLSQILENGKKIVGDNGGKKAHIERLQGMLKEIRAEMDSNLVAATDRIDLLWHELSKFSKSGRQKPDPVS
jgi:hypothetical protein